MRRLERSPLLMCANRIGAAGSLTIANLATPGDGSTLRFVPGTGNVTLTQFGGANIGVGLLSPHVFFGTGNSGNYAYAQAGVGFESSDLWNGP